MELRSAPLLRSSRLLLRPAAEGDVDALLRLWTDPDVRRYLWDDEVISRERAASVVAGSLESFASEGLGQFVVTVRRGKSLAGFAGLRRFGPDLEVELLFGVAPRYWGRGVATEAARAMLRDGFGRLGLGRIFAGADPPNVASFRVMEKLGMRCARRLEIGGREAIYWALSRTDFRDETTSTS